MTTLRRLEVMAMNDSPMRPPLAGRDDEDLDGRRIPVVERLEQGALFERARHRVHVTEVLEPVGQVDPSARTTSDGSRLLECAIELHGGRRSIPPPHEDVDAARRARPDARVGQRSSGEHRGASTWTANARAA
ncbi:MAG: hypothetical protein U0235_33895 [Polyangiaceae bacterium]